MNRFATILFGVMLCFPAVVWTTLRVYNSVVFDIHCTGHIKRAADANTVDMAKKELDEAIEYLVENDTTKGYTSILWKTPDADVGFWFDNLSSSRDELSKVTPETSQLEKTNVLMKLRETLLDHEAKGDSVTIPGGMSVFPYNSAYFWLAWIFWPMAVVGAIFVVVGVSDN